ncbi:hypothetical protein [Stenotrophomonas geniculata]|uniref:hypothetical protein n=1 Tax=Stenotrophomonas geniculata TaxID=86188 RepID=UPI002E787C70|nr:hypothetical protein [Stenotrophomonas geniculata]
MSTDKTLADVQPGGRVRLGDQAERARFEAWAISRGWSIQRWAEGAQRYCNCDTEKMWEAFQAALSAQPSPGGQDALADAARRVISDVDSGDYGGTISMATYDALVAALAARQPVGEPFGYCADFDPGAHEFSHTFYYLAPGEKVPEGCTPFFTKQPAQVVDLGQIIDEIAQQWDGCNYDAVGETIDVGQAIRAAGKRLALIDSQAVGNG